MRNYLLLLLAAVITGCGQEDPITPPTSEVARIEVTPADTLAFTPSLVQLRAVVYDTAGKVIARKVQWSVDGGVFAVVDSTGLVQPKTQHQFVYVRATVDDKSAVARIYWTTGTTTNE